MTLAFPEQEERLARESGLQPTPERAPVVAQQFNVNHATPEQRMIERLEPSELAALAASQQQFGMKQIELNYLHLGQQVALEEAERVREDARRKDTAARADEREKRAERRLERFVWLGVICTALLVGAVIVKGSVAQAIGVFASIVTLVTAIVGAYSAGAGKAKKAAEKKEDES